MRLEPVPGEYRPPGLVREPVYCAEISKKLISRVIDAIKTAVPSGTENIQHIKRVQPGASNPENLNILLCSQSKISLEDLTYVIEEVVGPNVIIQQAEQSKYPARTKEEAEEWSRQVWPLVWRGNVLAQPPKITTSDEERALEILDELSKMSRGGECSEVCWIVDPDDESRKKRPIGRGVDNANEQFSRRHAVMQAIDSVARFRSVGTGEHAETNGTHLEFAENQKAAKSQQAAKNQEAAEDHAFAENQESPASRQTADSNYLCLGLDVYCLVEPCVMCCMALVHSRIGRLFFRLNSPLENGAINFYCLHGRTQLNHTYEAWRLVSDE